MSDFFGMRPDELKVFYFILFIFFSVILVQKQNEQLINEELIFRDFHEVYRIGLDYFCLISAISQSMHTPCSQKVAERSK